MSGSDSGSWWSIDPLLFSLDVLDLIIGLLELLLT